MDSSRRKFITTSSLIAMGVPLILGSCSQKQELVKTTDYSDLDDILSQPVLKTEP